MTDDKTPHQKPSIDWKKEYLNLWGYCEHILKKDNILINKILGKRINIEKIKIKREEFEKKINGTLSDNFIFKDNLKKLAESVYNYEIKNICDNEKIINFVSDFSIINLDDLWTGYVKSQEDINTSRPKSINELFSRADEKDEDCNLKYPGLNDFLDYYTILNDKIYHKNYDDFHKYFWLIAYNTRNIIVHYEYEINPNNDIENLAKYCYLVLDLLF